MNLAFTDGYVIYVSDKDDKKKQRDVVRDVLHIKKKYVKTFEVIDFSMDTQKTTIEVPDLLFANS